MNFCYVVSNRRNEKMIYYLPKNLVAPVSNTSPQANIKNPRK